jgi:ribonucleoside-diphosphate reductase alpha chain
VLKRNGQEQPYDAEKIKTAVAKAFIEVGEAYDDAVLTQVVAAVEAALAEVAQPSVEAIQDQVEFALMASGYFTVAKTYILYRDRHAQARLVREALAALAGSRALVPVLEGIARDFPDNVYDLAILKTKAEALVPEGAPVAERLAAVIRAAVELTSVEAPRWEFIAGRLLAFMAREEIAAHEHAWGMPTFAAKVAALEAAGLYASEVVAGYTPEELNEAATWIDTARDELFTYAGLDLFLKRYCIRSHTGELLESPQEAYLGIALYLALAEKPAERARWARAFYHMLSLQQVTMATPTLANARKPFHQLSSCFIDTVPDSLTGIYGSVANFAQVSKYGGGMGMYLGKVRAQGGSIRGFEGAAGGVVRWIRVINDTAVAVDQLGVRQGAVAVYLDIWHRDLPEFLQLRTNNGDDRMKAHDVFPAVCVPDLFWRLAKEDIDATWYLMCPHDILLAKGWALEDSYGAEWEERYLECVADPSIPKREMSVKDMVRLMLKSAVETGTPFVFNRDAVNAANPNPHAGMIYCSNLCTEIAQNMSAIQYVKREVKTEDGDTVVVSTTRPGDFVVCNLASLSLGRLPVEDEEALRPVVAACVRALDNVIDLNFYMLPYAELTTKRYRAIGLGVSGYHHMLATRGIAWESQEHLDFVDGVFERINRLAVEASCDLAAERGAYELFPGSDWQTGAYFDKRDYTGAAWDALRERVAATGMRNGYLMAIAPTSSTSILAGTTAGLDPIMRKFFMEEKKGAMLPRVAPDLSLQTFWYYRAAHTIDQTWSIQAAARRQRHIDQAQSMNLYITNEYTMRQVLNLYLKAWEGGVKTIYYVRSQSLEVAECESCSS